MESWKNLQRSSRISLIIATHNGTKQLDFLNHWIENQAGWAGPLIVIASGDTSPGDLATTCKRLGIDFVFRKFVSCGHAKRNLGAKIAAQISNGYAVFLNDYQHLPPQTLQLFEQDNYQTDVVLGFIESNQETFEKRISKLRNLESITKSSLRRDVWKVYASISESGLIVQTSTFLSIGGWQYPDRNGKLYFAGDGVLLAAKLLSLGKSFSFSQVFKILGGHSNPSHSSAYNKSKVALYPYAFTLSTMKKSSPLWIRFRFLTGRLARLLLTYFTKPSLFFEITNLQSSWMEIEARLRGIFGLPPSSKAESLIKLANSLCAQSNFTCEIQGGNKCESSGRIS